MPACEVGDLGALPKSHPKSNYYILRVYMSGETQKNESGWTVDTLKEHVTQRFDDNQKAIDAALVAQEKAVAAALAATKEAINKAEVATGKRFESVNEFRAQLADQSNTLMPRQEYTVQHKALESKLSDLTDRINIADGKIKGAQLTSGKIYAAIGGAVAIISIIVVIANSIFK
jgi:hypothetical protein